MVLLVWRGITDIFCRWSGPLWLFCVFYMNAWPNKDLKHFLSAVSFAKYCAFGGFSQFSWWIVDLSIPAPLEVTKSPTLPGSDIKSVCKIKRTVKRIEVRLSICVALHNMNLKSRWSCETQITSSTKVRSTCPPTHAIIGSERRGRGKRDVVVTATWQWSDAYQKVQVVPFCWRMNLHRCVTII